MTNEVAHLLSLMPKDCGHKSRRGPNQYFSSGSFKRACDFLAWAIQRDEIPSASDIERAFGVSRATSYRWASYYADAFALAVNK